MMNIFEYASRVTTVLSLISFAITAILSFVVNSKQKQNKMIFFAIGSVVIMVLAAIITDFFSQKIYRIRITVLGTSGMPVDNATVSSTLGGESKQVSGGWELDIDPQSVPKDKKIKLFAEEKDAYLTAAKDTLLSDDYNFSVILQLAKDSTARISGTVKDERNRGLPGVKVYIDGYERYSVLSRIDGTFDLSSHAANGEKIILYAEKKGYQNYSSYFPADENSADIPMKK